MHFQAIDSADAPDAPDFAAHIWWSYKQRNRLFSQWRIQFFTAYIISQSLSTQLIGQTIINTQSSMVMFTQQQHIMVLVSPQRIHYISKSFTQLQSLHAASLSLHAGSTIQSPMQSSSRNLQAASSTQHVCSLLHTGSGRCTASRCSGSREKNLSLQRSPIQHAAYTNSQHKITNSQHIQRWFSRR